MNQNEEHLKLLSVFHYVVGGLAGLFSLFPIFHLAMGLMLVMSPEKMGGHGGPPPAFIGWMFVIMGSLFILMGLAFAGCVIAAGRFLAARKYWTFCLVMGGVDCLMFPFGTVLGVFTIIVLIRDPVKALFAPTASMPSRAG